ncbi:protein disulfide isomerase [Anaeramoeba flamelloides]|uniref:Protein disulfide isomerase n=1 Tax=Anaeramoeba flamelloides TaxID=1746091 RepID=A0ABQ8X1F5_9EUKA|nr:protein disulfide isomerase [Anaeramoeba flamelloides]
MKSLIFINLALVICFVLLPNFVEPKLTKLTSKNYEGYLGEKSTKPCFILLTSDKCEYCDKMEMLFTQLQNEIPQMEFLSVHVMKELETTLKITNEPKQPSYFIGQDGMFSQYLLPGAPELILEDFKELLEKDKVLVVDKKNRIEFNKEEKTKLLIYQPNFDPKNQGVVGIIARHYHFELVVAVTTTKAIAKGYNLINKDQAVLIKNGEKNMYFKDKLVLPPFKEWVDKNKNSIVTKIDNLMFKRLAYNTYEPQLIFISNPNQKTPQINTLKRVGNWLEKLRKDDQTPKTISKLHIYWIDKSLEGESMKFLSLKENENLPLLLIWDINDGINFRYDGKVFTVKKIKEWILKWSKGQADKYIKSSEPPIDNDGPITILTAKTFDEIVLKSDDFWFVEFMADWCSHCKKLQPIYEELAEWAQGIDGLRIGQMNGGENDIKMEYDITGFPSLLWFGKNKQKFERFNKARELNELKEFILERLPSKKEL